MKSPYFWKWGKLLIVLFRCIWAKCFVCKKYVNLCILPANHRWQEYFLPLLPTFSEWLLVCSGLCRILSLKAACFFKRQSALWTSFLPVINIWGALRHWCLFFLKALSFQLLKMHLLVRERKTGSFLNLKTMLMNMRNDLGVATSQFHCKKRKVELVFWQNFSSKRTVCVWSVIFSIKHNSNNKKAHNDWEIRNKWSYESVTMFQNVTWKHPL